MNRSLRILFTVHGYKPAWRVGGPIYSVSALAEKLVERGHRVTVFTTNSNLDVDLDVPTDQPVHVDGVEVWYFRRIELLKRIGLPYFSRAFGFLYTPAMGAVLERKLPEIDLVHTHMPFNYQATLAARAAFRAAKPLVYHQRGVLDPERVRRRALKKKTWIRMVEVPIMNRAARVIALTEHERDVYRGWGVSTSCEIIPNGVDPTAFRSDHDRVRSERPLGLDPEDRVILFLSRLHPVKGADVLLEAFARIALDHPSARLVLAGPDEMGLLPRWMRSAVHRGLKDRVLFPGMVSGAGRVDLLARADLFCLPSEAEGFSMAVLEALASGTPVILSPGCHFPEVERDRVGTIVQPDAAILAAALDRCLRAVPEPGLRSRTRRFVTEHYSWDTITDRMVQCYAEALEERQAPRVVQSGLARGWRHRSHD